MKRLAILILSLLYLTASTGATIHLHYCMDELVSWGIDKDVSDSCSNCGMAKEDTKGCCKDEHKQVKVDADQKATEASLSYLLSFSEVVTPLFPDYQPTLYVGTSYRLPFSNAPPDREKEPLYLQYRVFRI
ncbi:hypothetical protein BUE76_23700 [Cnuella takakiae]|nr:hypothetical protein BUE76_23700 [Cnuella takakiae]